MKNSKELLLKRLSGYPLLGVALSLIVGVILGVEFSNANQMWQSVGFWIAVLSVVVGIVLDITLKGRKRQYPLFMSCFILGGYFLGLLCVTSSQQLQYNNKVQIIGVVDSPIQKCKNWLRCEIKVLNQKDSLGVWHNGGYKILANFSTKNINKRIQQNGDTTFSCKVFDTVAMQGRLRMIEGGYGEHLQRKGIIGQIYCYDFVNAGVSAQRDRLWEVRQLAHNRMMTLDTTLSAAAGLISAMVVGEKSGLEEHITQSYRKTGLGHLLAISGLHIGIVVLFLNYIFGLIKLWDRHGRVLFTILIILALWSYALFSGMALSVQRAAIMFSLYQLALLFNRSGTSINILSAAAIIIILINPMSLWEIGFQLSFAAMLGISIFYKPLSLLISPHVFYGRGGSILRTGWNTIAISIAAQLAVAPLVIFHFEHFPWFSIFLSLVSFITVPVVIACGLFYIILGIDIIGYVGLWTAELQNSIFSLFSTMGWVAVEGVSINLWQLVVLYLLIAFLGYWLAGYSVGLSKRRLMRVHRRY